MGWLVKLLIGLVGIFGVLAVYTGVSNWRNERSYPPSGALIDVDGQKLHFVNAGTGDHPIVLLHGASSSLRDFEASLMQPLAENNAVFAFDRPGYGYSERGDGPWPDPVRQATLIHDALNKLGVEKPILVGHSWAGSVVLAYMLAFPDEVSGGVLLAGAVNSWKTGVAWFIRLADMPVIGPFFAHTLVYPLGQLMLRPAIEAVFAPDPVPPGYKENIGAILALRPGPFQASAQDVHRLSDFLENQGKHYDSIKSPLLMITGEDDTIVPAWNHADRLIKRLPHANYVKLPKTGHALHHSRRDTVVDLIETFVENNGSRNGA